MILRSYLTPVVVAHEKHRRNPKGTAPLSSNGRHDRSFVAPRFILELPHSCASSEGNTLENPEGPHRCARTVSWFFLRRIEVIPLQALFCLPTG